MGIDLGGFLWSWFLEQVLRRQFPELYDLVVGGETTVAPGRLQIRSRIWTVSGQADGRLRIRREQ